VENLPTGPFETEDQALADPSVAGIYEGMRRSDARMQDGAAAMILAACQAAGVILGAYDARIVRWLAGFEPQAAAAVAGIITRAAAGKPDADAPRCAQCGGLAEEYPDPYMDRMLWRHRVPGAESVAEFLDGEHEATPAGAL
jgi:hypothetical protein